MDVICPTWSLYILIPFLERARYVSDFEETTPSRPRPKYYITGSYLKFIRSGRGRDWTIYIWASDAPPIALLLQSPTTADLNFASATHVVSLYPYTTLHLQYAVRNINAEWESVTDETLVKAHLDRLASEQLLARSHPGWDSIARPQTEYDATQMVGDIRCFTLLLSTDGMATDLTALSWARLSSNSFCHRYTFSKGIGLEFSLLRQCHWANYYIFSPYVTGGLPSCDDDDALTFDSDDSDSSAGLFTPVLNVKQVELFSHEPMSRHPDASVFVKGARLSTIERCIRRCQPPLLEYDIKRHVSSAIPHRRRDSSRDCALIAFFRSAIERLEPRYRPSPLLALVVSTSVAPLMRCLRFPPTLHVEFLNYHGNTVMQMMTTSVTVWIVGIRSAHAYCLPVVFQPHDHWNIRGDRFEYTFRFGMPSQLASSSALVARYTGVEFQDPYHEVARRSEDIRVAIEDSVVRAYGDVQLLHGLQLDCSSIRRGQTLLLAYLFHFYEIFSCYPDLKFSFPKSYMANSNGLYIGGTHAAALCVHIIVPNEWPLIDTWPFQAKLNPTMVEELKEYMITVLILRNGVPWTAQGDGGW
ncbi:hypothetical protein V5O48_004140 [Marasmius crinis-equi]|uniref:Uncharacterized protein n=1 Tax=Marasmius crinis-equi TaxID=585013 RepID=A0ABR3FRF4_9AGAR